MNVMQTPLVRPAVELAGITKVFPGSLRANDQISCELRSGEIHALLGENGAGKTTLMRILSGFYRPDEGVIRMEGQTVVFGSPRDAKKHGIGMVHQHFSLVPALSVAENLALGAEGTGVLFRSKRWNEVLRERARELQFDLRWDAPIWQLSMGERQRVEVFRLLLDGARVLILDEPTSILAPHEAGALFAHLSAFKAAGHAIFLVTHKIEHVVEFADRVTVLRQGRVMATREVAGATREDLARLMVGRPVLFSQARESDAGSREAARPMLTVENLAVAPISCPRGLLQASFSVGASEIVGVAGIGGSGQDELVAALTRRAKHRGSVILNGSGSDRTRFEAMGHVPGDRHGVGVAPTMSVAENLCLRSFRDDGLSRGPLLLKSRMRQKAVSLISAFAISPSNPDVMAGSLSGGNIQKVLLAREFERNPGLLIAVTPTAGLDVATVEFVHERLQSLARQNCGILLVSEDLDELLILCDRILVLFEGRMVGTFARDEFDRTTIGLLMSGVENGEASAAVRREEAACREFTA